MLEGKPPPGRRVGRVPTARGTSWAPGSPAAPSEAARVDAGHARSRSRPSARRLSSDSDAPAAARDRVQIDGRGLARIARTGPRSRRRALRFPVHLETRGHARHATDLARTASTGSWLAESEDSLRSAGVEGVYTSWRCVAARMLGDAVFDGHRLAREIDSADPAVPLPLPPAAQSASASRRLGRRRAPSRRRLSPPALPRRRSRAWPARR